ncbi:MAG: beta-N-acetylhexosaminidase [Pseudomonadota bacterium]
MAPAPLIVGLSGTALTPDETAFLADLKPLGIILFARNVGTADELRALIDKAKSAAQTDLVFIDQEGGRVQRLKPPLAPIYPPARRIGELFAIDQAAGLRAARLHGQLIAADCLAFGITVPCIPVADVPIPGANDVIGDRAYGLDPAEVSALAKAAAEGVLAAGALPVVKHIPGHGRAMVDSHLELPTVDAPLDILAEDFGPFKTMANFPIAMTAHVRYTAIDEAAPATLSAPAIDLIRNTIGFGGLLLTDDICMHALAGPVEKDGAASLSAGCDVVLHCNGNMAEMVALAKTLPAITGTAATRLSAARAMLGPPVTAMDEERAEFDALIARRKAA